MTKWLVIGGAAVLVLVLAVVIMRFARTPAARQRDRARSKPCSPMRAG
jgi:hypothetical protein